MRDLFFSERRRGTLLIALMSIIVVGCAASAQFHPKSGRDWQRVTRRAVLCNEDEARTVAQAGGFAIGTITARGLTIDATQEDLADKAAVLAGKMGGTHLVLTDHSVEWFTTVHPAVVERQCQRNRRSVDCRKTYTPSTTSQYSEPRAKFLVFRLPEQEWSRVPPQLVPGR